MKNSRLLPTSTFYASLREFVHWMWCYAWKIEVYYITFPLRYKCDLFLPVHDVPVNSNIWNNFTVFKNHSKRSHFSTLKRKRFSDFWHENSNIWNDFTVFKNHSKRSHFSTLIWKRFSDFWHENSNIWNVLKMVGSTSNVLSK